MAQVQYVSTISGGNDDVVAVRANQVNTNYVIGEIRDTGHSAYVRSTYAARYNFGVNQYNTYETDSDKKKRHMRGGRFFLFNIIVFIFFVASMICAGTTSNNKAIGAAPITISVIYLLITFYNWYIYCRNGSLIHENMIEVSGQTISGSINKHFTVPIHACIQNREIIAASDGSTTAILARLQQRYQHLTEIQIMLYSHIYKTRYASFSGETILHFILFSGTLIWTIFNIIKT
jgi:hypothetical protein